MGNVFKAKLHRQKESRLQNGTDSSSTPVGSTMQFPGRYSCASTSSTQYFKAAMYADKCRLECVESICPVGRMG